MTFKSVKQVFSVSIFVVGLLVASSLCFASSITGDTFAVTVSEDSVPFTGSESGVAGSPEVDVVVYPPGTNNSEFKVDWINGNTFKINWYAGESRDLENLTIALTDLNFVDNDAAVDIIGVTFLGTELYPDYPKVVSHTSNSITIVYRYLSDAEAADGSDPSFAVTTAAPVEPCECDLNKDGFCNILDYQIFIQDWGRKDCPVVP